MWKTGDGGLPVVVLDVEDRRLPDLEVAPLGGLLEVAASELLEVGLVELRVGVRDREEGLGQGLPGLPQVLHEAVVRPLEVAGLSRWIVGKVRRVERDQNLCEATSKTALQRLSFLM